MPSLRLCHAAAERNKLAILSYFQQRSHVIRDASDCFVLEVASGTGQHAAYFHGAYPLVFWQTTEFNRDLFQSIRAWIHETPLPDPMYLDASQPFIEQLGSFYQHHVDLVFNCNMVHISPKECTVGLMRGAAQVLKKGGHLVMYGPFKVNGNFTTDSNRHFDQQLKLQHPEYELKDVTELDRLAGEFGLKWVEKVDMPAHNFILTWCKVT